MPSARSAASRPTEADVNESVAGSVTSLFRRGRDVPADIPASPSTRSASPRCPRGRRGTVKFHPDRLLLAEIRVERIRVRAVDLDLREHRELHRVARGAERLDLALGARSGPERSHGRRGSRSLRRGAARRASRALVLRGVPALARDVDDEEDLARSGRASPSMSMSLSKLVEGSLRRRGLGCPGGRRSRGGVAGRWAGETGAFSPWRGGDDRKTTSARVLHAAQLPLCPGGVIRAAKRGGGARTSNPDHRALERELGGDAGSSRRTPIRPNAAKNSFVTGRFVELITRNVVPRATIPPRNGAGQVTDRSSCRCTGRRADRGPRIFDDDARDAANPGLSGSWRPARPSAHCSRTGPRRRRRRVSRWDRTEEDRRRAVARRSLDAGAATITGGGELYTYTAVGGGGRSASRPSRRSRHRR